jgi:hypothetical protein
MQKASVLVWLLIFIMFGTALTGCSNSFIPKTSVNEDGIPLFISSTLTNASYLGGSNHGKTARYLDGQQVVGIRDHPEVTATFYNFGFWEGDEIELPQENIRSMWHNNDYESNIRNATKKWIAEYSLYYLADGTAYCDCRYKLRVNAPLNGIYYCYSEVTYIGSIDISTLLEAHTTSTTPTGAKPPANSSEAIATAIKDGQIVDTGSRGDYIVKVRKTDTLSTIGNSIKDSMFVSVNPFPYIEDGYMLINVVPEYSEYRVLDPNILAFDNNYYSVVVHF